MEKVLLKTDTSGNKFKFELGKVWDDRSVRFAVRNEQSLIEVTTSIHTPPPKFDFHWTTEQLRENQTTRTLKNINSENCHIGPSLNERHNIDVINNVLNTNIYTYVLP